MNPIWQFQIVFIHILISVASFLSTISTSIFRWDFFAFEIYKQVFKILEFFFSYYLAFLCEPFEFENVSWDCFIICFCQPKIKYARLKSWELSLIRGKNEDYSPGCGISDVLRYCSKGGGGGRAVHMWFWWRGRYMQTSTHFIEGCC